jgi:cell wall-associated NlpC family hydrolase
VAHASPKYVTRALAVLCLGATGTTILTAAPAVAAPSVDQAEAKVDRIDHDRAEVAQKAQRTHKNLVAARRDLTTTTAELSTFRTALAEVEQRVESLQQPAVDDGIDWALTAAAEVTTAPDPEQALDAAQDELSGESEAPATDSLHRRLAVLEERFQHQTTRVRVLTTRQRVTGDHLSDLKAALARANDALEEARAAAEPEEPAAAPVASGGAAAAVAYAMAQVGDAYVYGAAGPDAFDCSGLTMASWAQGGVALPHSSGAQMGSGTPVSIDALQPGDLVFYYSPVSHVGIYVGNGQLVHAANPGTGVQITSVSSMPISGAVRPG